MSVECFVTGGTGFIGQHLVAHLSAKGHTVRVLMRRPERLTELREQVVKLGGSAARVFAVAGDLERDNLGLSPADRVPCPVPPSTGCHWSPWITWLS
ncbi:hypothetical protein PproGo58_29140 [Pseudomonas protegens]|nr:hypothetical protein PproGo58_29140 [Pseudomonas protegens]